MRSDVDASTVNATRLFSGNRFVIPDFQRDYAWEADKEVSTFFDDLESAPLEQPYFLGLIITTTEGKRAVVDGQQRILTLSLLAAALRRRAHEDGRALIAESMRDIFLFDTDYGANQRTPRLEISSEHDRAAYAQVLDHSGGNLDIELLESSGSRVIPAYRELSRRLSQSLAAGTRDMASWAELLTKDLEFALFEHPDRAAAYRVFEVVNTRGRALTPAELIKSYIMGNADDPAALAQRWTAMTDRFRELGALGQFTLFIRNVVTLEHGYVLSRDLYSMVSSSYTTPSSISGLLDKLEHALPLYVKFIDLAAEEDAPEYVTRAFALLDALQLRTIRPLFLALAQISDADEALRRIAGIIVPRIVVGAFGTGSVESRFAEAAKHVTQGRAWQDVISHLEEYRPQREAFLERLAARPLPKSVAHAVRSSILEGEYLPSLSGTLHYVRPRYVTEWPGFTDWDFRELGGTLGNTILSTSERRPHGTNSLTNALSKLLPTAIPEELPEVLDSTGWSADEVRQINRILEQRANVLWYK